VHRDRAAVGGGTLGNFGAHVCCAVIAIFQVQGGSERMRRKRIEKATSDSGVRYSGRNLRHERDRESWENEQEPEAASGAIESSVDEDLRQYLDKVRHHLERPSKRFSARPSAFAGTESGSMQSLLLERKGHPFDFFALIALIGEGAFGKVFLAALQHDEHAASEESVSVVSSSRMSRKDGSANSTDSLCSVVRNSWAREVADFSVSSSAVSDVFEEDESITEGESTVLFALKVVQKDRLHSHFLQKQAETEVRILRQLSGHPFIVGFKFAFQTPKKLYIGMEFCASGELFTQMTRNNIHTDDVVLYVAEISLALNHLHSNGVLYRDLKPENIGLSSTGHIRLLDFGLSTIQSHSWTSGAITSCGTLTYSSPEVLRRAPHRYEVDWWSLGVITYEILVGFPPFDSEDQQTTCDLICSQDFEPAGRVIPGTPEYHFVSRLLDRNQYTRLGADPSQFHEILDHEFFQNLEWDDVLKERYRPHLVYKRSSIGDVGCFSREFTEKSFDDELPELSTASPSPTSRTAEALVKPLSTVVSSACGLTLPDEAGGRTHAPRDEHESAASAEFQQGNDEEARSNAVGYVMVPEARIRRITQNF